MIQNNSDRIVDSKQVDMDNFFCVVQYCENVFECRRVQLLYYFGEMSFGLFQCCVQLESMCDICVIFVMFENKEIMFDVKVFVENVNFIVYGGNRNWRKFVKNFMLNYFIDIFKVSLKWQFGCVF